ncbi:hypothetical protein D9757_001566 [Collybiopsis confluens]|uniref:Uncharacterized protein n=1 Tax=Collybiopsis confluens TaxID=2823264 RepID=A0A8H5HZK2_9AGAR|nr:hypothetical protein D9757_001566 [Collybiopsis confluens]
MTSINDHVNGAAADIDFLSLDPETRNALGRLQKLGYDKTNLSSHSPRRLAAVLLLLYYHEGALRILLTTRSKNLRSHPGQASAASPSYIFHVAGTITALDSARQVRGAFQWDEDDRTSAKDKVRAIIMQVWKVTGYRFTVKNHKILKSGHYTRLFCSQDKRRKRRAKKSKNPEAKLRDTLGMKRFNCQSLLTVSYALRKHDKSMVQIHLQLYDPHVHYYDVGMPEGAAAIIRQHAEWQSSLSLVPLKRSSSNRFRFSPADFFSSAHFFWLT